MQRIRNIGEISDGTTGRYVDVLGPGRRAADNDIVGIDCAYRFNESIVVWFDNRRPVVIIHIRFVPRFVHNVRSRSVGSGHCGKKTFGIRHIRVLIISRMPIYDRVYSIGDARVNHGPYFIYRGRGIILVVARHYRNPNSGAFPVLGEVVYGAGIVKHRPLRIPVKHRHAVQGDRIAVLIDNPVAFHAELAVDARKGLLPETDPAKPYRHDKRSD